MFNLSVLDENNLITGKVKKGDKAKKTLDLFLEKK